MADLVGLRERSRKDTPDAIRVELQGKPQLLHQPGCSLHKYPAAFLYITQMARTRSCKQLALTGWRKSLPSMHTLLLTQHFPPFSTKFPHAIKTRPRCAGRSLVQVIQFNAYSFLMAVSVCQGGMAMRRAPG